MNQSKPIIISRENPGELGFTEFDTPGELAQHYAQSIKVKGTPKLSIAILSYRNINCLKVCIDCVLRFVKDIDFELILMDNASDDDDETLALLRSVPYDRKTVIQMRDNIGRYFSAARGFRTLWNFCSGDYILHLNDDHYITENAVQNMIKALDSDPSIGMVNPMSSNAMLGQNPGLQFTSLEGMFEAGRKYNVYDPRKWHQRLFVAAVAWMFRSEVKQHLNCANPFGFEFCYDTSLLMAGYKVCLLGDTWVHHEHDYSVKETHGWAGDTPEKIIQQEIIEDLAEHLYFGLHWVKDVCVFEHDLVSLISPDISQSPSILAIDVKAGQGLLDMKNRLRSMGIFECQSAAFSTQAKYYPYLYHIADTVYVDRIDFIESALIGEEFDCILVGSPINLYPDPIKLLSVLLHKLSPGGQLLFKVRNVSSVATLMKMIGSSATIDEEMPFTLTEDNVMTALKRLGYTNVVVAVESHDVLSEDVIKGMVSHLDMRMQDHFMNIAPVRNFLFSVTEPRE